MNRLAVPTAKVALIPACSEDTVTRPARFFPGVIGHDIDGVGYEQHQAVGCMLDRIFHDAVDDVDVGAQQVLA